MNKMVRTIIIAAAACVALGIAAWCLLKPETTSMENKQAANLLADKNWQEVEKVTVANEAGIYTVEKQENQGYKVHDLPPSTVNMDYVAMLLDECSQISYEEVVEEGDLHPETYGLDVPEATVEITYSDQSSLSLYLGMEEPVSKGRYARTAKGDQIVLLKGSRCVRFLMPVEKYIDYIIIEPNESTDLLRSLGDMTLGGRQFPEPVVLKEVTAESDEELLRMAASFVAVTHIITKPVVHEADPTALTKAADSLMGLISEGIVAYNCDEAVLEEYGFDDPLLTLEFDYRNQAGEDPEHILLQMSQLEDGTKIVTRDAEGIIYRIADVAFTEMSYDDLVLRWFLTPLLADVKALKIETGGREYLLETSGSKPKEIYAVMNGQPIDSDLYRKFYNLVVSAAADGPILEEPPEQNNQPIMEIQFYYEDENKAPDCMKLYEGPLRRLYVEINGICEYTIREKYMTCVQAALEALPKKSNFSQDW